MKELRKRVNGLIAILLAVCLVLEMSGIRVSAGNMISLGINHTPIGDCVGMTLSEVGDGLEYGSSGGCFTIDSTSDEGIRDYFEFGDSMEATDGVTAVYMSIQINKELPVEYQSIKIASISKIPDSSPNADYPYVTYNGDVVNSIVFQWVPIESYILNYNFNGGTGTAIASQKQLCSETYSVQNPSDLTRTGYEFAGWSFSADGSGTIYQAGGEITLPNNEISTITNGQTLTLYAVWKPYTYYANFDPGSAGQDISSGDLMNKIEGTSGQAITLPECTYTREGFVFKGWSTNPNTLTAEYQPGDAFTYLPQTDGETVTLYAIWGAEGANAADGIQVGVGTVYLKAGQKYVFGEEGVYNVAGDPTSYPMNTIFYVPTSGYYTISVQ